MLDSLDVPVDFVAWTYSEDDQDWRLIIATPLIETEGRTTTYERIRQVIAEDPWLDPGVGRVVLVSPDDPGVLRFREMAKTPAAGDIAVHGERGVIRGRSIDDSYVYNTAALRFEEEVFAALQRLAPPAAVLRRAGKVFETPREIDFVLDSGRRMVLVEAKGTDRPVELGELRSMQSFVPSGTPFIVVSRGGFVEAAATPGLPELFLVTWRSRDDDRELRAALDAAFAPGPS